MDRNNRSGAATNGYASSETEPVRIFFPTSWARLHIATSAVYDQMYPEGCSQELDNSALALRRHTITEPCRFLFAEHCGEEVQCGPGSIIRISAQNSKPHYNTPFNIRESGDDHYFDASITAVWCVGKAPNTTSSADYAMKEYDLSTYEKHIISNLLTADSPIHGRPGIVRPGDTCTLLGAERQCDEGEYMPVLIHRFWRSQNGMPSIGVVWMCPSQLGDGDDPTLIHPQSWEQYIVKGVRLRRRSVQNNDMPNSTQGKLADGTPYIIYRILLYCDYFQKSSAPNSNAAVGGCYFMPLALRPEQRRKTSSARLISLTPPGVSTNDVLHYIVDDLVHGTVCGVQGYTPLGLRVRIFLDVVGFIGDYPASSAVTDVIGHVGRSPCTLCSFRRLHVTEAEGSRFGYSTDVHASNSAFLRSAQRHSALRKALISSEDATILGMGKTNITNVEHWPSNHLSAALHREMKRIPLFESGQPVVTGMLDPYRSNFIAPDHLLTGLAKDVLNTVFKCMPTCDMRNRADAYICAALRTNGLLTQTEAYN